MLIVGTYSHEITLFCGHRIQVKGKYRAYMRGIPV